VRQATRFPEQIIDEYVGKGHWDSTIISESWDENAVLYPDDEAIIEEHRRIPWSQAKLQVDRLALGLLELGIKRGERVAVQLYNCVELLTVRLACEKAGIIAVTLLPNFRHAEVAAILKHTEAVGVVIPKEFRGFDYFGMIQELRPEIPFLKYIFVIGDDVPEGAISVKEMANQETEKKYPSDYLQKTKFNAFETFQIATTTGTTGMPKCIEFVSCVRQFTGRVVAQRLKITHDDVVGAFAPVIAGGCYNEVYRAAPMMAAKIILAKYFTAEEILGLIERERVTAVATVPTVLIRTLEEPKFEKYDLSSLRFVKYGGALLPYDQALNAWEKFRCPVLPAYGTLDIGTIGTSFVDSPQETLLGAVYRPLDGVEIRLVDTDNKEVPSGEIGELLVRGPNCQPCYYNDPEATAEVCRNGWFYTGDLASFDAEKGLVIRGRRKDVIIRGGQNIHPLEIETMLLKHPKVLNAAVVGMPDPEMLEKACAYVVIEPGEEFGFSDMKLFLKEQGIAPFKIPERLEVIDDMPLAGGIKVDKKQLREDIEARLRQEAKQGGRNPPSRRSSERP
jgi:non-ribosomal peptide synthetase component E (peptide arylation enzyme)